jgi:hypothetical protein
MKPPQAWPMLSALSLALVLAFPPRATAALKCSRRCADAIASCRAAVPALGTCKPLPKPGKRTCRTGIKADRKACRTDSIAACKASGGTLCSATTSTLSGTTTTTTVPGLPTSANGISVTAGGPRTDPEGVAPPAAETAVVTWKDSRGADRALTLGAYLYQYDFSFTDNQQEVVRSANDDAFGHAGFGYVVSHNTQTANSPLGKANPPTNIVTTVFSGGHHAIHHVELVYDRDREGDGFGIEIPVVIDWLVATGRDHPVWAVTWRVGQAVNPSNTDFDVYRMDVRGPYGSLNFDGAATPGEGDAIGGVAWGDFGLRFTTTDAELTLNSPWTYDTPNSVPFVQTWTATTNAEMGIVETRAGDKEMGYPDRVVDRERGSRSSSAYTDKQDCTGFQDNRNYVVPCVSGWPYQLMNYDWDPSVPKPAGESTGTKIVAWGSPYGWLGASNADLFDFSGTVDARGDRSFATFIVLGPHCRFGGATCDQPGDVATTVQAVEALAAATVSNVTVGSVVSQVPKGPGATETKTLAGGYDDTYAVWRLTATDDQVAFTFAPAAGQPVANPIFVIGGYTAPVVPQVSVGGASVSVNTGATDSGAFVSLDTARSELWVTLNRTVSATVEVQVAH